MPGHHLIAAASHFAISRTGAIAAIVAERRHRRDPLPLWLRVGLLVLGATIIGAGAALTLASGLGAGPFDVLVSGIASTTGLAYAPALWSLAAILAIIATVLGSRPGPGTAIAPLIIGPVIGALVGPVADVLAAGPGGVLGTVVAIAVHVVGVGIIGIGAGAMVGSSLGAGTGDLLAAATSDRLGRPTPMVRTALEVAMVAIGVILGGPLGVGTIIVALLIGYAVRTGHRIVERRIIERFVPAGGGSGRGPGEAEPEPVQQRRRPGCSLASSPECSAAQALIEANTGAKPSPLSVAR